MGLDSVNTEPDPLQAQGSAWIETFRRRSRRDLRAGWHRCGDADGASFLDEPWGRDHRPDWAERGLLVWPRGRQWLRLEQHLHWPKDWSITAASRARLALSWWAESMRLWVDGALVHEGDLFDTACRWVIPDRCRGGAVLHLQLELCSPAHDDGALISSDLCLEPCVPGHDPDHALVPEALQLHLEAEGSLPAGWSGLDPASAEALQAVRQMLRQAAPPVGSIHWLGHAHLDLAWLWPVADTWMAAERTFRSTLDLMRADPDLRFAHSTPALYAWLQAHRPALFQAIRTASLAGRWEPINGPWVETDCVLVSTASLWQQFQLGQEFSRTTFPEWTHDLAWLPDSFGFGAGLPAVAAQTGVRWFCTHKLAWNATNPFPHRLFRWRCRGGGEVLALMLPPIGRRGDPLDMLQEQRAWQAETGVATALWIPGVGDHGGGPTQEMLEQMQLWDSMPQALPRQAGSVRDYLRQLEPLATQLPVWRDELYLELHRGCATSRPDQKRHNRSLERLLREADAVAALQALRRESTIQAADWRPLLFQQFHDILPGTSIPEVFEQADPVWRSARRTARLLRDEGIRRLVVSPAVRACSDLESWAWFGLQPLQAWSPLLRLPPGRWRAGEHELSQQPAAGGGVWVQLPSQQGVSLQALQRDVGTAVDPAPAVCSGVRRPVRLEQSASGVLRIGNGLVEVEVSSGGVLQIRDSLGRDQLSAPCELRRFVDRGEFWDAWDLADDYRSQPLAVEPADDVQLLERGPLQVHVVLRLRAGSSVGRLDLRLCADRPWLEVIFSMDWRQRHELLRFELPLAQPAVRFASDTSGGVLERPAQPCTARERSRWEVPVIAWVASQAAAPGGGMAVLLDGPQGIDCAADRIGVSLLRGPTWPDPGADRGWHRQRLALMPLQQNWDRSAVPQAAIAFREPGWWGPLPGAESQLFVPSLPAPLVPVAMQRDQNDVVLKVLNPSSRRCVWTPGDGWSVHERGGLRRGGSGVTLTPGELVQLVLRQSS